MEKVKLYSGTKNASSWAMRAWLALKEAGIDFDEEVVDIRRPQRFPNLQRIAGLSPSASVPALTVGDTVIFDSLAIMEYANEVSGGALMPSDMTERARARSFLAWQHSGLSNICARISFESAFYPFKRDLSLQEQAECGRLFSCLEDALALSGGPFLFGALSLADLALTPTVIRLTSHEADLSKHRRVEDWTRVIIKNSHVEDWLREAVSLPHIWFDNYLSGEGAPGLRLASQGVFPDAAPAQTPRMANGREIRA